MAAIAAWDVETELVETLTGLNTVAFGGTSLETVDDCISTRWRSALVMAVKHVMPGVHV